jgi:hypothetical protein
LSSGNEGVVVEWLGEERCIAFGDIGYWPPEARLRKFVQ